MPDEPTPLPPLPPPAGITPAAADGPPAPGRVLPERNGPPPETNGVPTHHDEAASGPGIGAELRRFAGWCAGLGLVLVCGWGLLALALWLTRGSTLAMILAGSAAALLSLGLFLQIEKDLWLSRLLGLRLGPRSAGWQDALFFWLLGPLTLLFRSTEPSAAQASAGTRTHGQPAQPIDSVREVIETVVFVVVLVLMLKSFAAEAFVIPTGSMAETLWGYQKEVVCPSCGLKFPVNASSEVDPTDGQLAPVFACTCPNCRQHIHFPNAPRRMVDSDSVEIPDPTPSSGDRVLVAKFVYDLLQRDPDRLDVVVFKYPGDERFPEKGPYLNNVPMNYIKRLIGLPGETIAIHGGNVYVLAANKGPHYDEFQQARNDPELFGRLWQKKYVHVNEARQLFENGQFQIIRKDPETLLAMMRLVYDNDHPGKDLSSGKWLPERWAGDGWQVEGRGFRSDGKGESWLRYSHMPDRDKPHQRELITDFMGYNTFLNLPQSQPPHRPPGQNWASDLVLECEVTLPDNPSGELTLELSRGVDRFRARFDLASGQCILVRDNGREGRKEQELSSQPTTLKGKGTYRLRFANVDQRLTLWVDGRLPFGPGETYDHPAEGPDAKNDLQPVSVGVRGAAVEVRKLKVFRDTYYTASDSRPSDADFAFDPGNPGTWEGLRRLPVLTLYVQPEHYLCLGDNSQESSDGRSWGTVPRRLLLGRAVLVYYPFGRAGRIR